MKFQIVSNIPKIWIVRSCCFLVWKMKRKYISLFTNFYRYSEISYLKILFGFCSVANVCLDWYATWYVNMDCQRKLSILVQIPNYILRNKNAKILKITKQYVLLSPRITQKLVFDKESNSLVFIPTKVNRFRDRRIIGYVHECYSG